MVEGRTISLHIPFPTCFYVEILRACSIMTFKKTTKSKGQSQQFDAILWL